jgi:hypothetical protein
VQVLPYYTVEDKLLSSDVLPSQSITAVTLNRQSLLLKRSSKSGRLTANGTSIVEADLVAFGTAVHFLEGEEVPPEVATSIRSEATEPGTVVRVKKEAGARRRGDVFEEVDQTEEDLEEEGIVAEYLFERAEMEAEW